LVAALAKRTLLASSSAFLRSSAVRSGARRNINRLVYHRRKGLGRMMAAYARAERRLPFRAASKGARHPRSQQLVANRWAETRARSTLLVGAAPDLPPARRGSSEGGGRQHPRTGRARVGDHGRGCGQHAGRRCHPPGRPSVGTLAIAFAVLALMLVVISCAPQAAVNQKFDCPSPRNERRVRLRSGQWRLSCFLSGRP
jgi:hypothetical protein